MCQGQVPNSNSGSHHFKISILDSYAYRPKKFPYLQSHPKMKEKMVQTFPFYHAVIHTIWGEGIILDLTFQNLYASSPVYTFNKNKNKNKLVIWAYILSASVSGCVLVMIPVSTHIYRSYQIKTRCFSLVSMHSPDVFLTDLHPMETLKGTPDPCYPTFLDIRPPILSQFTPPHKHR